MTELSYGDDAPKTINVVIEIQKGGTNKYELDKKTGKIFLDRVNGTTSMGYPTDYGYVPDTLCEDGDPLDALLIIDESVPPGIVVPCRPLGVLKMVDDGEGDEKLICVAADDVTKSHINSVEDLGENFKPMIEHFYSQYKAWKNNWKGSPVSFNGWGDSAEAEKIIRDSIDSYKK
ncbi:MAG TPA: inorganic diphosphatase [Candidatus Saccharimonadales bacterium]|nr:inorganic diphosphatase [Candidatus Saccharimonadales bacterium]